MRIGGGGGGGKFKVMFKFATRNIYIYKNIKEKEMNDNKETHRLDCTSFMMSTMR